MGLSWSSTPAAGPEVDVSTGRLRGRRDTTLAGTRFFSFLGIPYAKPPIGELRFKAPLPAEPWTGVRDATVEGNICCQGGVPMSSPAALSLKIVIGALKNLPALYHRVGVARRQSEDCLFLNVFVPESALPEPGKEAPPLRPVVFWIHGGGFKMCDGNPDLMNPDLFVEKDIIVVTINYRLGPLGFLALGTVDVPGNAGLKDQALALKWTHDNIRAFGGDPAAITVYGESAGGASSHHLSLSPLSRGLFRSVIASSGSAVFHWATTSNALNCARGLAKQLGIQADSPEEMARALRAVSADKLNAAADKMKPVFEDLTDQLMFLPVVEPDLPGAFLTEDPVSFVRSGKAAPVPLMTGVNTAEGLVWVLFAVTHADKTYRAINALPYYFLPPDLRAALSKEQRDECVREILDEYTGGQPFTKENVATFIELWGDVMFMIRQVGLVNLHTEVGASPIYQYRFNFVGKFNCIKALTRAKLGKGVPKIAGAAHGDELWYLSNIRLVSLPAVPADGRDRTCQRRMVQLWANFIETGNPTPPGTDATLIPVQWTPCTKTSRHYLDIGDDLAISEDKLFPRQAFWEALYQKYLGKPLFL